MALGNPTIAQYKKSATAPLDVLRFTFAGDAYTTGGGYVDFQTWVRSKLGRNVSIAFVYLAKPLLSVRGGKTTINLLPTYDIASDKLYFTLMDGGTEAAAGDISAASTIDLILVCF